jgi:hypothetical protein
MSALLGAYTRAVAHRPLATSMALGFVIAGVGDVVCQRLEGAPLAELDARRVAELSAVRALVNAPLLHVYLPWLASLCPGTSLARVGARVVLDSVLGSPVNLCLIFAATSTLKGRPLETGARIQEQLLPTWLKGVTYWPFVHFVNFRFFSTAHQGLVAHLASVWWMVLVSRASNAQLLATGPSQPLAQPAGSGAAAGEGLL